LLGDDRADDHLIGVHKTGEGSTRAFGGSTPSPDHMNNGSCMSAFLPQQRPQPARQEETNEMRTEMAAWKLYVLMLMAGIPVVAGSLFLVTELLLRILR